MTDHNSTEAFNRWAKSSYSGPDNNCVEVCIALHSGAPIAVRDTKQRDAGTLTFSPQAWRAFIAD